MSLKKSLALQVILSFFEFATPIFGNVWVAQKCYSPIFHYLKKVFSILFRKKFPKNGREYKISISSIAQSLA